MQCGWLRLGVVWFGLTSSFSAQAFENQLHLGGAVGEATFAAGAAVNPAVGIYGAYGLSDVFDIRLESLASWQAYGAARGSSILTGALGLMYKVDVIQWIPWIGPALGVHRLGGHLKDSEGGRIQAGPSLLFGLDYAWSRSLGLGLCLGAHAMPADPRREGLQVAYLTSRLGFEYRWGW